jgi:hypothetical protein
MQSLQQTAEKFNDLYVQAKEMREFAVSLEGSPMHRYKGAQAEHWHAIADALMEAVSIYDDMVTTSNKPLWARPKQKTM